MFNRTTAKRVFLLALFLVTVGTSVLGQSNKATIVGTTKDPNDALVAGAKITVINNATGVVREAESSDDGTFTITNLEPGAYTVTANATGFQTVNFENVQLETNARQPLDVKFTTITGGTGTVTITADTAPLVESETSVRGDVITGRQVTDLPIAQRNFTLLAALSPGVTRPNLGLLGGGGNFVSGGGGQNNTESTRFRESGGSVLVINGARATNNNFRLDGVDNNESQFGQIAIYPQPDFVSEFKVESSVPTAESGRAGGGVISVTTKSGGNELHGTVGEIYQGRFLSAAAARFDDNPANIVGGVRRQSPNYVTHNYFATVGGPVFLPRFQEGGSPLYDGRNRSFFFFSLNGQRNSTPIFGGGGDPLSVPVPTARMRLGDFGELIRPGTTRVYQLAGGGTVTAPIGTIFAPNGTPIPGNDLRNCPSCGPFSPFASNYLNAFPLPNLPGIGRNYATNRKEHANVDSYDIRFDHRITDNNSFFARYSKSNSARSRDNFFLLGTSPPATIYPLVPQRVTNLATPRVLRWATLTPFRRQLLTTRDLA